MKLLSTLLLLLGFCGAAYASHPLRHIRYIASDGTIQQLEVPADAPFAKHHADCPSCVGVYSRETRAMDASTSDGLGKFGQRSNGILNSIGKPNIPVIMVEFADVSFQPTTTAEKLDSIYNVQGYKMHNYSRGSVKDYFRAQSYGAFEPNFTVVTKVKLPKNRAYYGGNTSTYKTKNSYEMYMESIRLAIAKGVDFSQYKVDNGVPLVVLHHAGPGEHDSYEAGSEDYPWAHFSQSTTVKGGLTFQSYFMGSELMNTYKTTTVIKDGVSMTETVRDANGYAIVDKSFLEGIGVFCHELSHALGLPDTYATNGTSNETPDYHDLMDYAQYGYEGYRPFGYSAHQRSMMGWLDLKELTNVLGSYTLAPIGEVALTDAPKGYVIRNSSNPNEYFILENRQPSDYFTSNIGSGMLIYQVNYDRFSWLGNSVNTDPYNLRYVVIPADNQWQGNKNAKQADYKGDFFPGLQNVTEFSATSTPAMVWKSTVGEYRPLYNINQSSNGNITFNYIGEGVNSIHSVEKTPDSNEPLWSIDGRKVNSRQIEPGLYIQEGRKIIINN